MLKTQARKRALRIPYIVPAIGLGLVLSGIWLGTWHVWTNAAGWFAPATALVGLTLWLLSGWPSLAKKTELGLGLSIAGWVLMSLAVVASLSLGAFLPPALAEWVSPVLGKFGGGLALSLLALTFGLAALSSWAKKGLAWVLDCAIACGLAAVWVGVETSRQATFPPPPTDMALLASRFDILGWLALAFSALYFGLTSVPFGSRVRLKSAIVNPAWRWGLMLSVVGLTGSLALNTSGVWQFGLLTLTLLIGGIVRGWPWPWKSLVIVVLKAAGWLLVALFATILLYFSTTEDLEATLLRNTAERYAIQFWRWSLGDERFEMRPTGLMIGQITDQQGKPVAGASVVVAGVAGQTWSAMSGADGRYRLPNLPEGNYLPMAISADHQPGIPHRFGGRVVTVQPANTTAGVDFRLEPKPIFQFKANETLRVSAPQEVSRDNPEYSPALRRTFTFENRGKLLDGGLIHEPAADRGPGPFPTLLIIYPGPASAWENVSIPLAARGYVVVSFFPNRLLDLAGDLDDLDVLTSLTLAGKFSSRADKAKIALVGGSVSTVYTYAMERSLAGSPAQSNFKSSIKYGGLLDMYRLREEWERGQVIIDPGISELEYLLIAFGRPDTRPELYLRFSPYFALKQGSLPPTLLVHVTKDVIVPVEQSQRADELFERLLITRKLLLYNDLEHYLDLSKQDPAYIDMLNQTVNFLKLYFQ